MSWFKHHAAIIVVVYTAVVVVCYIAVHHCAAIVIVIVIVIKVVVGVKVGVWVYYCTVVFYLWFWHIVLNYLIFWVREQHCGMN